MSVCLFAWVCLSIKRDCEYMINIPQCTCIHKSMKGGIGDNYTLWIVHDFHILLIDHMRGMSSFVSHHKFKDPGTACHPRGIGECTLKLMPANVKLHFWLSKLTKFEWIRTWTKCQVLPINLSECVCVWLCFVVFVFLSQCSNKLQSSWDRQPSMFYKTVQEKLNDRHNTFFVLFLIPHFIF